MNKQYRKRERGISLVMALMALMLLSAIAIGMMFISSTETTISSNFRAEETAYFAARAGVEEARDRMLPSPPNPNTGNYSINSLIDSTHLHMPGSGTPYALYILNGKNLSGANMSMTDVTSFASGNQLVDDEFCHDFYNANTGMTYQAPNIKCTNLPGSSAWYTSSAGPFIQALKPVGGNSNPVDYKWVRITLKENASYGGSNTAAWLVPPANGGAATDPVCFKEVVLNNIGDSNGASEVVATGGQTCAGIGATPVYLVTALAVTSSGGRRIVQQELAQTYQNFNLPAGMFAVGNNCPALTLGGGATTYSFNSSAESPPTVPPLPQYIQSSGGNAGTNGDVQMMGSSVNINGTVFTNQFPQPTIGGPNTCPTNTVMVSGSPHYNGVQYTPQYVPPIPPMPNPLPPTNNVTWNNATKSQGSYGNVTIQGNVTLQGGPANNPAVFTLNSLTFNGSANLTINGYVILNLAGTNLNNGDVLKMTGNSGFTGAGSSAGVPGAFVINYGGSAPMEINGGANMYAAINAPKSNLKFLSGGGNYYGQIVANTIDDQGGTSFYWDTALQTPPPANQTTFAEISLRELTY